MYMYNDLHNLTPLQVLLVEPLHGVTFALLFASVVTIAADVAPEGLQVYIYIYIYICIYIYIHIYI